MTHRERALAILNYRNYDRIPIVHFGYWHETLTLWQSQGLITEEEAAEGGQLAALKQGFEYGWGDGSVGSHSGMDPVFEIKELETFPDGTIKRRNHEGVIELVKPGVVSIPSEVDHTLKTREDWERDYKHRFVWNDNRVPDISHMKADNGKAEYLRGVGCGSMLGNLRNIIGVTGLAYIYADDEDLFREMVDTLADLHYRGVEGILKQGVELDFGHYWEDICFRTGPLFAPGPFAEIVGPHYARVTALLKKYGIELSSLDCDGCIDALVPIWLKNGVNVMFPIEVGVWEASIKPWREKYGKELRGVGGMDKRVFAQDKAAVDREIERLKPLIDLGGFIPCPDHRIPPDAKYENVVYYTEKLRKI